MRGDHCAAEVWDVNVGVGIAGCLTDDDALALARRLVHHHGPGEVDALAVILEDGRTLTGSDLAHRLAFTGMGDALHALGEAARTTITDDVRALWSKVAAGVAYLRMKDGAR